MSPGIMTKLSEISAASMIRAEHYEDPRTGLDTVAKR
jgi:hypothetical protein